MNLNYRVLNHRVLKVEEILEVIWESCFCFVLFWSLTIKDGQTGAQNSKVMPSIPGLFHWKERTRSQVSSSH